MSDPGKQIKKLRLYLKLTQDEFAKALDYKRNSLSMIESNKNKPTLDLVISICRVFDVPAEYFLYDDNPSNLKTLNNTKNDNYKVEEKTEKPTNNDSSNISTFNELNRKTNFWIDLRKLDSRLDATLVELNDLNNNISEVENLISKIYLVPNKINSEIETLDFKIINSSEYKVKALKELEELKKYHDLIVNLNHGINSEILFVDHYTEKSNTHKQNTSKSSKNG